MKDKARSAVLLLPLLAWPAAAADCDSTARTVEDARGSGKEERAPVQQADGVRKFDSEQPEAARRRQLAVNLFVCANGLPGCDESLLTAEQRTRFMNRPAQQ